MNERNYFIFVIIIDLLTLLFDGLAFSLGLINKQDKIIEFLLAHTVTFSHIVMP